MRSFTKCLTLAAVLAGCDSPTEAVAPSSTAPAPPRWRRPAATSTPAP